MNNQTTLRKSRKQLLITCFVLLLIGLVACNSSSNETGQGNSDTTKKKSTDTVTAPQAEMANIGRFKYLTLDKKIVIDFFENSDDNKKCNKVVFRFYYDETTSSVTLEAFGHKNNDKKFLPGVPLKDFGAGRTLGSKLYLSDLEFDKKMYDALGKPSDDDTHLFFYPVISSTHANSVAYIVEWIQVASFAPPANPKDFTGQELNPSPPADPR